MAGLRWALETGNAAGGLQLAAACGRFFSLHGRVDAQPLLEGLLDLAGRSLEDHVAASVLDEVSGLALLQGDASTAEGCARDALAIAQRNGDLEMELDALNSLGGVTLHEGELDQSRAHEERILELAGRAGLNRHVMKSLVNIGWVELAQGRAADARQRFAAALELADQLQDRSGRAYALLGTAEAQLELGELELAQHALDTAVPLHEADNNVGELLSCIECAAALAARRGEGARAQALFAWCRAERERRRLRLQPVYFAPRIAAWEAAVEREPGTRDETLPRQADLAEATRWAIRRSEPARPGSTK